MCWQRFRRLLYALLAWQQTEGECKPPELAAKRRLMSKSNICCSITVPFDVFGDFQVSSLLQHAISTKGRIALGAKFASTLHSKKMLCHHDDTEGQILAGQRRRGQRLRHRVGSEKKRICDGLCLRCLYINIPSSVHGHRARNGEKWGVRLGRETHMCLVTFQTVGRRNVGISCFALPTNAEKPLRHQLSIQALNTLATRNGTTV